MVGIDAMDKEDHLMNLWALFLTGLLGGNLVLSQFVDITLLRNLRKLDVAFFVGIFMVDITFVSGILFYGLYHFVLVPNGFTYLGFLLAMLIIALVSQGEQQLIKKFFPTWFERYQFYFPLITTNAVIAFVLMTFTEVNTTIWEVMVSSLAVPLGFVMINLLIVIYQERLEKTSRIPVPFQGLGITFILLALITMAIIGLGGL
jgi:Na+-translocating ferredoxin:NAD+ oxidoreductase RnfA subunit